MTTYFYSKKSTSDSTDVFMPLLEEVAVQDINTKFLKPILSFSPAKFHKLVNVPKLHFILTDGTIESLQYKVLDNGKIELTDDVEELYEMMDSFDEDEFSEMESFYLEWETSDVYLPLSEESPVRLQLSEKPDWLQSGWEDTDWGNTIFVASMKCYYSNETFFLFYNPDTKSCLQISQST